MVLVIKVHVSAPGASDIEWLWPVGRAFVGLTLIDDA
jgi:hypothetical protein